MSARSQNRPVILTFTRYYLPGYKGGGPIRSIANMVEWLGDQYDFHIVTSDHDYTETQPYPSVVSGAWNRTGKARVLYLPSSGLRWSRVAQLLREEAYDVLYLNSFFDPDFTLKPLLTRRLPSVPRKPVILAPRGELSEGSRRQKTWKKTPFLILARMGGLYRDVMWHASTEYEKADISMIMRVPASGVSVARNLPEPNRLPVQFQPRGTGDEPLRVCFLSRISPEKNLDFALDVLRHVRAPVHFNIYGPIRDGRAYWEKCLELMRQLPRWIKATYHGSVEPSEIGMTFARSDLFFLPTQGENFGHVIVEALTSGTPVLIADTTPWRDLAVRGVGWDLPLSSPEIFAQKIEEMAAKSSVEQEQMRKRVQDFAVSSRQDNNAADATNRLFLRALGAAAGAAL